MFSVINGSYPFMFSNIVFPAPYSFGYQLMSGLDDSIRRSVACRYVEDGEHDHIQKCGGQRSMAGKESIEIFGPKVGSSCKEIFVFPHIGQRKGYALADIMFFPKKPFWLTYACTSSSTPALDWAKI
jgi:hypothetical protein